MKLLTIDGGGIRGIVSSSIIEMKLREEINDIDIFAGVSTGSMIASALAVGYTPKQIQDFYIEEARQIFPSGFNKYFGHFKRIIKYKDISVGRYSKKPLKKLLDNVFGNITMGDLHKRVFILTYNLTDDIPILLDSMDTKNRNLKLADACLMSSSAPIYFNPFYYKGKYFVDGSVISNRIALYCYIRNLRINSIIEVGTGFTTKQNIIDKRMGLLDWSRDIVHIVLKSASLNTYILQMLPTVDFVRYDALLPIKIPIDSSLKTHLKIMTNLKNDQITKITNLKLNTNIKDSST